MTAHRLRPRWRALAPVLAVVAGTFVVRGQSPEELARRQYASGVAYLQHQQTSEALKDFEAVQRLYPSSSVADDALLEIARYRLQAFDIAAAEEAITRLRKNYPASNSVPHAYVLAARATLTRRREPRDLDGALADLERVERLFHSSTAVPEAVYEAGEVLRYAGRCAEADARYAAVVTAYPRSVWAARASLGRSACMAQAPGRAFDAMLGLQRVVDVDGASAEAAIARDWNTILDRLYFRAARGAPFAYARPIAGPGGKLIAARALAFGPYWELLDVGEGGVSVVTAAGSLSRVIPGQDVRGAVADRRGTIVLVLKSGLLPERGPMRAVLVPRAGNEPKPLNDITAAVVLSTGGWVVADRGTDAIYRFGPTLANTGLTAQRADRLALNDRDVVAALDRQKKEIAFMAPDGRLAGKIGTRGTGWEFDNPVDIAFDPLGHLYVLDEGTGTIDVFSGTMPATLLTRFTAADKSLASLRDTSAFAIDRAGRAYVYSRRAERVHVYQ